MKGIDKIEEYYNLCWEYLKQSEKYKGFCERIREGNKIVEKETGKKVNPKIYSHPGDFKRAIKDDNEISQQHPELQLSYIYGFFGDIYVSDFEEWWKYRKSIWEDNNKSWYKNAVREYYPNENAEKGRQPFFAYGVIKEGESKVLGKIYLDNNIECHLKVDLLPSNLGAFKSETEMIEVLKKQFEKIIKAKYKENNLIIPKRIETEKIELYLKVYDYKCQGLKYRDIIDKCGYLSDEKADEHNYGEGDYFVEYQPVNSNQMKKIKMENLLREFKRYKSNAIKIIDNVERGIFPGEY